MYASKVLPSASCLGDMLPAGERPFGRLCCCARRAMTETMEAAMWAAVAAIGLFAVVSPFIVWYFQ